MRVLLHCLSATNLFLKCFTEITPDIICFDCLPLSSLIIFNYNNFFISKLWLNYLIQFLKLLTYSVYVQESFDVFIVFISINNNNKNVMFDDMGGVGRVMRRVVWSEYLNSPSFKWAELTGNRFAHDISVPLLVSGVRVVHVQSFCKMRLQIFIIFGVIPKSWS